MRRVGFSALPPCVDQKCSGAGFGQPIEAATPRQLQFPIDFTTHRSPGGILARRRLRLSARDRISTFLPMQMTL